MLNMLEYAKRLILDYLSRNQNCTVSFCELEDLLNSHGLVDEDPEHSFALPVKGYQNLFIWVTNNRLLAEALRELEKEDRIFYKPTHWLVYLVDGCSPGIPLAKELKNYKKPRWIPAVICLKQNS